VNAPPGRAGAEAACSNFEALIGNCVIAIAAQPFDHAGWVFEPKLDFPVAVCMQSDRLLVGATKAIGDVKKRRQAMDVSLSRGFQHLVGKFELEELRVCLIECVAVVAGVHGVVPLSTQPGPAPAQATKVKVRRRVFPQRVDGGAARAGRLMIHYFGDLALAHVHALDEFRARGRQAPAASDIGSVARPLPAIPAH
jgi:hypothetical protein